MGAESSVQRDGKSQEDASASASAGELSAEVKVLQEGDSVHDTKSLQKNGQISSMTSLNGHSEDNTLAEVGQPDGVSVAQKEESPETMDAIQDEVVPQVNGEKVEKESADANDISAVEEKEVEEKSADPSEVGFKKIFRFVGFKFTLKKDKSEEKDPVKLLTVKDKDGEEVAEEPAKEEEAATVEEKSTAEDKEADTEASTAEAQVTKEDDKAESTEAPAEGAEGEVTDEAAKEEKAEKEGETSAPSQEPISTFRKLFTGGLFSNLRKKASIKKTKEEEEKEEAAKTEEAAGEEKEEKAEVQEEAKEEASEAPEEDKSEPKVEATSATEAEKPKEEAAAAVPEEKKEEPAASGEAKSEPDITAETPASTTDTTDEAKPEEEKDKAPLEASSEAEVLSSQEKAKPQGSPLKKLFTGAGLKKLSTKKQKTKKDVETKAAESGEQVAEQLQSSTDSAEGPKAESGPSSPEESGEHVIAVEVTQNESSQETEGEVASDGEKKKEGIIAWSSFKKLVTPKKRVKRSSESEDEATGEKPAKSATLSSSESAALTDKSVEEESKEEKPTEEEPKTETTEKLVSSTEEPKKKMDTSVSWEALMCMGGPKKRTRKTSDSDDDDETKIEEDVPAAAAEGEQEGKAEAAIVTSQTSETDGEVVSSPEPLSSPPSAWDTLKRMVMPKTKAKSEEKAEESPEQVQSDGEAPKEEMSFSLRKFFPGRKKKKAEKQSSTEHGSGEEDSDTPAVVPLSEFDKPAEPETEQPAEEAAEPAAVQIKVTAEDRSPSWISANVEDVTDQHDQLSDIPEEAENAATPKSVDTDIADDDEPAVPPKSLGRTGRRLSTAEVKPVAETPSTETTPVPKGPESESATEVLEGVKPQISELPAKTSVAVESLPTEQAVAATEPEPPTETAECKSSSVLEMHARDEAMAICTGLGTKEIAKVALEKPEMPIVETMTVIHDALSTEVSAETPKVKIEEAVVTEDVVLEAQVHQIDTTELEPAVEKTPNSVADIQTASETHEPDIEKVGIISTILQGSEVSQPPTTIENSPKAVIVNPITPTCEAGVCTQSVQIIEPTIETKEVKTDVEQLVATEEITPVTEIVLAVTKEITSVVCEETETTTEETEPEIPVVSPTEEIPVITEAVVLVAPLQMESQQAETSNTAAITSESVSVAAADAVGKESDVEVCAAVEISEVIKDEVVQPDNIEAQSMTIAQNVIQDAVEKVSEDITEPEKPATPSDDISTPVQAVLTTEKEIEVDAEIPVVTETPITLVCEKPSPKSLHVAMEVTDAIPIEVIESIDAPAEEEKKEEKKPEEELKQAVEVKVSDESAVVEEVEEIKVENQTEIEEVKPEQDVSESVEGKPETEEEIAEAPAEEKKDMVFHMPVQVVLHTAQVVEDPSFEEEAAVEFDSNGPVDSEPPTVGSKAQSPASQQQALERLSTVTEEPPTSAEDDGEAAASQPETETEKSSPGKCAEVMAQVIEVIEEAVKEIEPVSTEITAAS